MCVHTDIGGHSDILAGAVTSNSSEFLHELAKVQIELQIEADRDR
jgi:cystathionine beta-lyase/cystathionine gamma-synthase